MILSDRDIRKAIQSGRVSITRSAHSTSSGQAGSPLRQGSEGQAGQAGASGLFHIHASSMDLHLSNVFKVYEHSKFAVLDPKKIETFRNNMRTIVVEHGEPFLVQPGEFVLGVTEERITVPDDLVVRVEGRSSLGRLGIIVHSTAGFVDPGFSGTITLEISNLNRLPVALYPGMRVCQIAFMEMSSPAEIPYDKKPFSKYQGQEIPEESKLASDPEFSRLPGQATRWEVERR